MHVGEMIRGRFVFYDEAEDESTEHTDPPIEDEHEMTLGVDISGRGVLRTLSYVQEGAYGHAVRTPILLNPGAAIAQRSASPIEHIVKSLDPDRVVGIWDFALA